MVEQYSKYSKADRIQGLIGLLKKDEFKRMFSVSDDRHADKRFCS